jgi:hypothetical protein
VFSGRYKALIVEGSGSGYLKTACDYAHLNPVRAGMLPGQERLLSHPNLLFVRPLVLSAARVITRADCPAATPPLKPNISPFRDRPFQATPAVTSTAAFPLWQTRPARDISARGFSAT